MYLEFWELRRLQSFPAPLPGLLSVSYLIDAAFVLLCRRGDSWTVMRIRTAVFYLFLIQKWGISQKQSSSTSHRLLQPVAIIPGTIRAAGCRVFSLTDKRWREQCFQEMTEAFKFSDVYLCFVRILNGWYIDKALKDVAGKVVVYHREHWVFCFGVGFTYLAACCWHPQSCVAYFPFNVQIVHRCHHTGIPELCLFSGPLQSGI